MAAFCSCCGAEITLKAEACTVCGTPRHGMSKPEAPVKENTRTQMPHRDDKKINKPSAA
jgi:hypothetical protein